MAENEPGLKDKPLFAFHFGKLGRGFSLSKTLCVFDSLFSAENLLTVNFRSCKSPAQVRTFAKTLRFSDQARFCLRQNRSDLRGQGGSAAGRERPRCLKGKPGCFSCNRFSFDKALQRFSPLKRQVQGIKSLLFHFASCGRTCKVPQAPTSFPPENLRTVNFRLSPTPVHARRWRDEIESSARGAIFEKKRQSVRAYCLVVLPPGRTKRCRWHPGAGPDFCENRLKACAWAVFCK